jgi:hypothetical protein
MKSFKPKVSFLSNSPVYSLLALYMPLTILAAFAFLLRALLPLPFPAFFIIISGVISAAAASFYCDFMKDEKASRTSADIRGTIIVILLSYTLSSLFRLEIPWNRRFLPGVSSIFASIGALYAWVSVISLKELFSLRKRFEAYTELHHGEQLTDALFGDPVLLQSIDSKIVKIRQFFIYQFILIGIILIIASVLNISLPLGLYFLLIAILVNGICIIGFFGIVRREQYFAGEGIVLPAIDRNKRILGMGIFAAICIAAAILVSSDLAILPFSLLTSLFGLLSSLARRPPQVLSETPPLPTMPPMDFGQPFQDLDTEAQGSGLFWEWMKYVLIALTAAGFIVFMISPLLNRGSSKGKLSFSRRLHRIIAEWLKGIARSLKSFFVFIGHSMTAGKTGRKLRKPGSAEIKRMAETVLGAYSQAKNREMRRSITLFARLIIWGGEVRNVEWKPALAPGEYCTLLAAASSATVTPPDTAYADPSALRRQNMGIIRCGELFEKALYSAEVLSEAERNEFKDQVELVVRTS